jgi:hypothetical protein
MLLMNTGGRHGLIKRFLSYVLIISGQLALRIDVVIRFYKHQNSNLSLSE